MRRAAAYLRVSSEKQADEDRFGYHRQIAGVREYANTNALELVGEYRDAITGKSVTRSGLDRLLSEASSYDVVIISSVDRLARDGGALARVVLTDGVPGWAVRATAPEVEDVLKPYGGARVVAPLWRRRGYIRPDPHGKNTRPAKLEPGEPAVRCYVFALEHFEDAEETDHAPSAARLDLEGRAN